MTDKLAAQILFVIFAVVFWTYWIPLVVAINTDTLTHKGIENKVRLISNSNGVHFDNQSALNRSLRNLEVQIATAGSSDVTSLVKLHTILTQYGKENAKRIRIGKYANSKARHYFFGSYLALSLLLFLRLKERNTLRPTVHSEWFHSKAIGLGLAFYVFFNWSNWVRNTQYGQIDRTLFSYAHFDVTRLGFVMQELQVAGMMILTGYIMSLFLKGFSADDTGKQESSGDAFEISKATKREFEYWQIRSLLLVLAFLPWTIFFWRVVTVIGESRYFPSAVSIHVIWLFVWLAISVPAFRAYESWQDFTVSSSQQGSPEEMVKIKAIEPVSRSMFAVTTVASAISFMYPFLQSFF